MFREWRRGIPIIAWMQEGVRCHEEREQNEKPREASTKPRDAPAFKGPGRFSQCMEFMAI